MSEDMILVLDFGGSQVQSVARKIRRSKTYCEIAPHHVSAEAIAAKAPKGLVLAGEAAGNDARIDPNILTSGIPMLAMGYSARMLVELLGGRASEPVMENRALELEFLDSPLLAGMTGSERYVTRMAALTLPEGFSEIARGNGRTAAFACEARALYGMQFYVESNDPDGLTILDNFIHSICGCASDWTVEAFLERTVKAIRERVGDGEALMSVSGGIDSTVCAMLMQRAIGERMHCLYVDTGLMREGETQSIREVFERHAGIALQHADVSRPVLDGLRGVCDPAQKRQTINAAFSAAFCQALRERPEIRFVARGTIYPDVIDSREQADFGDNHLCADLKDAAFTHISLLEPIRRLFKDEVRHAGALLGLPQSVISRQSFPGPGLAIRIAGEVTEAKVALLRRADAIFREEIEAAGIEKRVSNYFAVLADPDARAVALRAVNWTSAMAVNAYRLPYDLLERVCAKILSEHDGVRHVVYDVTAGAFDVIEWE